VRHPFLPQVLSSCHITWIFLSEEASNSSEYFPRAAACNCFISFCTSHISPDALAAAAAARLLNSLNG